MFPFLLSEVKDVLDIPKLQFFTPGERGVEKMREEGEISDTTKMPRTREMKSIQKCVFQLHTEQILNRADSSFIITMGSVAGAMC